MRAQRGQVMAFIAVALAIVLMPLAAYAIDVRTVSTAAAALQEATATAALEAAQQLDEIEFRAGGPMTIDAVAAGISNGRRHSRNRRGERTGPAAVGFVADSNGPPRGACLSDADRRLRQAEQLIAGF